ncbi:GspE/PulE family protein [Conexibacter sp. SYSU D00693]|uniref:GspE/PulE family protein n=1 Tax=Conexibacter sp. SYSU D00693 TaxID=2812560 RepID=UPI00196A3A43|nr:ATPase, T2SS/T4P/T4SS family [Conexibacter sp. SYSU D00693]
MDRTPNPEMTPEPAPHLRPVGDADEAAARPTGWDGITKPQGRSGSARFLTDVLVELGAADRARVDRAIDEARSAGTTPERLLLEQGHINQDQLARAVAERHGLDHLDLSVFTVDMAAANLVSSAAAKRYEAVPVAFLGERGLLVAMADPANVLAVDDIALMTGYEVRAAVASREDISALVARLSRLDDVVATTLAEDEEETAEVVDLHETADDAPIIKLVNQIVAQAVEQGASDIHLEPDGRQMRVRFRVDGVLVESTNVPRRMVSGVVSRVKIMSELDIAERRLPQDGRVSLTIDGHHVDLRVVTLPSVHGETVVIRILDKSNVVLELDKLGMAPPEHERFLRAIRRSYGATLVTGPTGSGKSTSLYAALGVLNSPEKNIITIEDPVEYQLDGVTQVQVNPKAGLTFANGLRSMMRADPDIIMVGEIRDRETAQIAVESALTGHLVLSTLHTNDAPTAITRLVEMGIEPFLVSSAIDCVVAQRLARTLCSHCKRRAIVPADTLRESGFPARMDLEAYEPVGCSRCGGSGYKGRTGLYEVMVLTEEIRQLAIERASADQIAEVAVREGMRRLREDGLEKVAQGRTSVAEIARVVGVG